MAIDTKPFVELAKLSLALGEHKHYQGCELGNTSCAVLYLAGALDAAQKRLDEYAAEIERLRAENAEARVFMNPICNDWAEQYYKDDDEDWDGLGNA